MLQLNQLRGKNFLIKRDRKIFITPSFNGTSSVDLADGAKLYMPIPGIYTASVTSKLDVNIKMWGAAGEGYGNDPTTAAGGGGGYSSGLVTMQPNVKYIIVVGEGGWGVENTRTIGNGGYSALAGSGGRRGGGLTGMFSENFTFSQSMLIAGGGGSSPGASYKTQSHGGAGGGIRAQDGTGYVSCTGSGGWEFARPGANLKLLGGLGGGYSGWCPGGGGAGYYGGGGSIAASLQYAGAGGGSGYINETLVQNGVTLTGNLSTPANVNDPDRINDAGQGNNQPICPDRTISGSHGLMVIY